VFRVTGLLKSSSQAPVIKSCAPKLFIGVDRLAVLVLPDSSADG
jgi:hypothetical protein